MVTCMNKERKYGSVISNGKVSVDCDNPTEYGGDGYVSDHMISSKPDMQHVWTYAHVRSVKQMELNSKKLL